MSDTPETDKLDRRLGYSVGAYLALKQHAKKLERQRDEAVRSCHIWQDGHSAIVADRDELLNTVRVLRDDADVIVTDRDYWRAEAERWRDCHHEIIADRDWLILELVEISSTADNCEDTWDALAKIGVIADNILNGREVQK
jgi:uncharacterized coiled-coil DUF342 family protein